MSETGRTTRQHWLSPRDKSVITILLVAAFVVILNETALNVALNSVMDDLGVDERTVQWLTTAFMLTMAVVIPITGWLLERIPTRTAFILAMSLFTAGTMGCAIAPAFPLVLAGRVVQAGGTAIMLPLLMTTIMQLVPPAHRGAVMGHARAVSRMIDELGFDAAFAPPGPGEPADLGRPPGLVDRMLMLTDAPLLARAGIQAVAVLARLGRPRLIRQGGLLHKQGEARTSLCLVGQGELQLAREGEPAVGRFGPGSVAGSLGMLARPRHDATLSAATDAVVLELDDDDFFEAMDDHFDLARAVFAYMAKERGRLMELIARRRALSS